MQTSEEGVQQTELKSSPNNPFRNPQQQQQQQQHSIYPPQYQTASIDVPTSTGGGGSGKGDGDFSTQWGQFKSWMVRWRGSSRLVLVIVAIALLLDNLLLTIVGELTALAFHPLFPFNPLFRTNSTSWERTAAICGTNC
jgi:hypothetical protein